MSAWDSAVDWCIGWWNWLKTIIYPIPLKRWVCSKRGHRFYQIDQTMWCTRCAAHEEVAE